MRVTTAALAAGLLVVTWAWTGPLPALSATSFSAHMLLHLLVMTVAAPLLAVGVAGGRLDPARWAPPVCAPIPASALELAVVWAWHAPALHEAARTYPAVFAAEQLSFLASGVLFWASVIGGPAQLRAANAVPALAALALTLAHMTLLGLLLSLSPRPLYAHAHAGGHDALADQQRGGTWMLGLSTLACVAGALVVGQRALRSPQAAHWEDS